LALGFGGTGALEVAERQTAFGSEDFAGSVQAHPARRALEQGRADRLLQSVDRAAERWLTGKKALCGTTEVQFRGNDQEGANLAHIEFRQPRSAC
jgi:hypothetical protein